MVLLTKHVMMKEFVTATKDNTVQECIELLFKRHVGSIIIVDNNQRCIGIFTERDAIRVVAQKVPLDSPIQKVMTKNIFTVDENATYKEAKNIIVLHGIRHLPVTDSNGKLVGLISIRQILNELLGT
jgi:CBS domain-containing protein